MTHLIDIGIDINFIIIPITIERLPTTYLTLLPEILGHHLASLRRDYLDIPLKDLGSAHRFNNHHTLVDVSETETCAPVKPSFFGVTSYRELGLLTFKVVKLAARLPR